MPRHAMAAQPLPLLSHTLTLYPTASKLGSCFLKYLGETPVGHPLQLAL